MQVWVCLDWNDDLFIASDALAAYLAAEDQISSIDLPLAMPVDLNLVCHEGVRWAKWRDNRIKVYPDGGYDTERLMPGIGWVERDEDTPMDPRIERVLCFALEIPVCSEWSVEELLAREG